MIVQLLIRLDLINVISCESKKEARYKKQFGSEFCVADVTVSELLQMLKKTANTKQIYHCD